MPYALSIPGSVTSIDVVPPRATEKSGSVVSRIALIFLRFEKSGSQRALGLERGLLTERRIGDLRPAVLDAFAPRFLRLETGLRDRRLERRTRSSASARGSDPRSTASSTLHRRRRTSFRRSAAARDFPSRCPSANDRRLAIWNCGKSPPEMIATFTTCSSRRAASTSRRRVRPCSSPGSRRGRTRSASSSRKLIDDRARPCVPACRRSRTRVEAAARCRAGPNVRAARPVDAANPSRTIAKQAEGLPCGQRSVAQAELAETREQAPIASRARWSRPDRNA